METCAVRGIQGSTVRTAKLFSDEVTCGTERPEHTSNRAAASGIGELRCVTHREDIPTNVSYVLSRMRWSWRKGTEGRLKRSR